ncbi:hypothetical protein H072_2252 [Dactylellina haptotyla CBS 200.50]|uniref:Uncharacterized protein n=1 Tax=Dactylellina haptotyla (strain CBS 200.50) TaxID=1284197 RepID=S8ALC4_DACHA|nr:hypothetical protein H072_2252 [Dactylellina haptotyla CBS 200.50]
MPVHDEVLPRFQIRASADGDGFHQTILHSHNFQPAEPAYFKTRSKHPDEYSIALLDAYIPDILFAQVVARPTISTPSLSLDEIRRQNNGGAPVLPTITLPTEFTIQLYNPESQVVVRQRTSKWTGSYWEFTLPRHSFRQPTGSRLDAEVARNSALPPSDVSTFRWRKDGGVVSKTSLRCTMLSSAATSGDKNAKKKGGAEPDITVAIMDKFKDVTIYEPSLHRVDVEDKKGLELVLVLTASVIADIYFMPPSSTFNIAVQAATKPSSSPNVRPQRPMPTLIPGAAGDGRRRSNSISPISPSGGTLLKTPTPPNNAHTVVNNHVLQDTAALQRQQVIEERRRAEEEKKRARETAKEEERIRKMLQQEDKDRKRREAQVAAETEKVRKQFGNDAQAWESLRQQQQRTQYQGSSGHQRGNSIPAPPTSFQPRPPQPPRPPVIFEPVNTYSAPPPQPRRHSQQLPPRQPLYAVPESQQARPPQGQFLSPPSAYQPQPQQQPKKKTSFLGLFGGGGGGGGGNNLTKKKSSFF